MVVNHQSVDGQMPIDAFVVEDDRCFQFLLQVSFCLNSRFTVADVHETVEQELEST